MRALRYVFDEAVVSLWRGRQSALLSVVTIALALFVLGAFLVITANIERLGEEWSGAAELSVYLQDELSDGDRAQVEHLIAAGPLIAGFEFVSKEEAARRFKATFADLAATMDSLEDNPLPASYEVRLTDASRTPGALDSLAARLQSTNGVADVRYDRQWLDRLLSGITMFRTAGIVLATLLALAAALTVANVVRLALHARQDEIEIMQLVGAPSVFVRGPFVMEGAIQGGLGALLALVVLAAAFLATRGPYLLPAAAAVNLSSVRFLSVGWCTLLLLGGMAVGSLGGLLAVRRV